MKVWDATKAQRGIFFLLAASFFFPGCASQPPPKSASHLKLETITNDGRTNYVFRAVAK